MATSELRSVPVRLGCAMFVMQALTGVCGSAAAADVGKTDALPFAELRLTLRASQGEYVMGEPIAVYAELANPHPVPVEGHNAFGWYADGGRYWYLGAENTLPIKLCADGRRFDPRYRPYRLPYMDGGLGEVTLLGPGFKRVAKMLLVGHDGDPEALLFSGELKMQVEFHHMKCGEKIASNPLCVTLRAPQGDDAEALRWLRAREWIACLGYAGVPRNAQGLPDEKQIAALKSFLEKHGKTVYGPHAHFLLGRMHFFRKEYRQAIDAFQLLVERHPNACIADDALYLVGESYCLADQRKHRAEATRWYREVLQRYPGTAAAQSAQRMIASLGEERPILAWKDPRLDAKITDQFASGTPVGEVLPGIAAKTGVPLRVAPELWGCDVGGRGSETLREFMFWVNPHDTWVREDDGGYRLFPLGVPR